MNFEEQIDKAIGGNAVVTVRDMGTITVEVIRRENDVVVMRYRHSESEMFVRSSAVVTIERCI